MNEQLKTEVFKRSRDVKNNSVELLRTKEQTENIMRIKMKIHSRRLEAEQQTTRKHHEELTTLKRSLETWQSNYLSLFSASPTGFATIYADYSIKEVNPALTAMLDVSVLDMLGESMVDFAGDSSRSDVAEYLESAFAGANETLELKFKCKDGTLLPVLLNSALIREDDQANPFCLCAVTDISELAQSKDQKAGLQKQLSQLQEHYAEETRIKKQLEIDISHYEKTIADMELHRGQVDQDIENLSGRFDLSQQQLTEQTAKTAAVETELEGEKKKLQQAADEKQQIQTQKNDLDQTVSGQMQTIEHLTHRCDEAAKLAQARFEQLQTIRDGLKAESQANLQLRDRIASAEKEIEQRADKLENTRKRLRDEVSKRRQLATDLTKSNEDLEAVKTNHKQQMRKLEGDIEGVSESLSAKTAELEELESKHASQTDEYCKLENDIEGLNDTLSAKTAEFEEIKSKHAIQTDECHKLEGDVEQLNESLSKKTVELDKLGIAHTEQTHKYHKLENDIERLNESLLAKIAELETLESKHADQTDKCHKLEDDIKGLNGTLSTKCSELDTLGSKHTVLIDEYHKLEGDVEQLNESLSAKTAGFDELELKYATQTDKCHKLEGDIESLNETLSAKCSELDTLESEHTSQTEKYQKLESEFAWLSHEHESIIGEKTERMNELVDLLQKQRDKHSRHVARAKSRKAQLNKQLNEVSSELVNLSERFAEQTETADHAVVSLEACQNLIGHLSESIPFTLSIYDQSQRKTICVSEHLGRQLGYSHRQIERLGEDFYADLIHPEDIDRMADELDGFGWDGYEGVLETQFRIKAADDSWRHIKAVELVFDRGRQEDAYQILTAHIDITEQKHTEQTINDLQALLEEKHAQLNEIFYSVSAARNSC